MLDLENFGVDESFLAHTPDETLKAHSDLTFKYFLKIKKAKNLDQIIDNLILNLSSKHFDLIKEMFQNAIYLHDIGKINPYFQANKMKNPKFSSYKEETNSTNHSKISANKYFEYYHNKFQDFPNKEKYKLNFILLNFSYHIAKHHGKLSQFEDFDNEEIQKLLLYLKEYKIDTFEFYILNKLLFSLLISSDYYATTEYMGNMPIKDFGLIKDKEKIISKFENYKIIKNIRNHSNPLEINKLRSEIFLESQENLINNLDKNIFYLEAPTGSGKTLNSINLALNLIKNISNLNKIFYIFPFNTLVEQTKKQFDEIFENEVDLAVINSITPIKAANDEEQEKEESKYEKSYVQRLFFHNEIILTSHVNFFNILFGTNKEHNFPLWQLANSVIILDEIQSYNNKIWTFMTEFLSFYAKILNIKIIIMSATLPRLDKLIDKNNDIFVELLANKDKYFQNPIFKNRVEFDFSLLDKFKEIDYLDLINLLKEKIDKYSKIMFEFIKKTSAREFFDLIKNDENFKNFEIFELSGDDNKAERGLVISKIKNQKHNKIILIATQVIEAGIDIDMDLGFKDISTLDSEEQFAGRINRSCNKNHLKPKIYFFNKDNASKIYKDDFRIEKNIFNQDYRLYLENKNFSKFYEDVFESIKANDESIKNGIDSNYEKFQFLAKKLNYKAINEKMELIKDDNFRLYFPFKFDISKYDIEEFKNLDKKYLTNGKLDGQKIWNEFEELDKISNFAKKEIKRSEIISLMQFFSFNIIKFSPKQTLPFYDYEYGGYYFISDFKDFIDENGKFDRTAYQNKSEDIFL